MVEPLTTAMDEDQAKEQGGIQSLLKLFVVYYVGSIFQVTVEILDTKTVLWGLTPLMLLAK